MTDSPSFPRLPRFRPPQPPSFAHLVNSPLNVVSRVLGRVETDLNQIATDLEGFGQPLMRPSTVLPVITNPPEVEANPPEVEPEVPAIPLNPAKGTACLACTADHLSTVIGALNEAMRFARDGGVDQEEVQRRLEMATDELNICERIDLAPDKTAALGAKEKEVAKWVLPHLRKLRHSLKEIDSTEELELIAATAIEVRETYSTRYKAAKGE
jgi:hypothetical protein